MEQREVKTTMHEMKYTLDGIDSRLEIAEEKLNKLDTIVTETIQTKTEREKIIFFYKVTYNYYNTFLFCE